MEAVTFTRHIDGRITMDVPDGVHETPASVDVLAAMVAQHNDSLMLSWSRLQTWLADDRELRVVEARVTADDPSYNEDGTVVIDQPFHWQVDAHEGGTFYGNPHQNRREPWDSIPEQSVVWTGYGATLDEAASEVLRLMDEYNQTETA